MAIIFYCDYYSVDCPCVTRCTSLPPSLPLSHSFPLFCTGSFNFSTHSNCSCRCGGTKIAARLTVYIKKEQCAANGLRWYNGVSGVETYQKLSLQYGTSVLPQNTIHEWIDRFENSRPSVTFHRSRVPDGSDEHLVYLAIKNI